jgi:hypothetical protein
MAQDYDKSNRDSVYMASVWKESPIAPDWAPKKKKNLKKELMVWRIKSVN